MKRIIICADGTWNEPEQVDEKTGKRKPTNVLKVARAVRARDTNGIDQVVYYHDGIGTNGPVDKWTGGAFGIGMAQNVRRMYRFIVLNFLPDDELYFFGFSRGAFTVRTLAGFMDAVGLLHAEDEFYTPELYSLYERDIPSTDRRWKHAFRNIQEHQDCPPIKFIGVWDTVGALGAPGFLGQVFNRKKYAYHDIELNDKIENAYHALALDERRKSFKPDLWEKPQGWSGTLEQAWFPGVHTNVGGGYHPDGLANEPLHWIIEKAENLGLEFSETFLKNYRACFNSDLRESMSLIYRAMGTHVRPMGRQPQGEEFIHQSLLDRRGHPPCHYDPDNFRPGMQTVDTSRIPRGEPCEPQRPLVNRVLSSINGS